MGDIHADVLVYTKSIILRAGVATARAPAAGKSACQSKLSACDRIRVERWRTGAPALAASSHIIRSAASIRFSGWTSRAATDVLSLPPSSSSRTVLQYYGHDRRCMSGVAFSRRCVWSEEWTSYHVCGPAITSLRSISWRFSPAVVLRHVWRHTCRCSSGRCTCRIRHSTRHCIQSSIHQPAGVTRCDCELWMCCEFIMLLTVLLKSRRKWCSV